MGQGGKWVFISVAVTIACGAGCSAEVRVRTQGDPSDEDVVSPRRSDEKKLDAAPSNTEKLSLGLGSAICLGRPNIRKAELAMNACSASGTRGDLEELHQICTREKDGECHMLSHRALRAWDSSSLERAPVIAGMCEVRAKEGLLAMACQGVATDETLTDLLIRCKGNDRTCYNVARTALATRNPSLAKKFQ